MVDWRGKGFAVPVVCLRCVQGVRQQIVVGGYGCLGCCYLPHVLFAIYDVDLSAVVAVV